jgi:hypothetical protein
MNQKQKNKNESWLCATEYGKSGVAYIFSNVYFSMDYKNMRYWENGLEWRIFLS